MEKIIKNCRGVKKCNDGVNRGDKENQRNNFIPLLGFKENDIYQIKDYSIMLKIINVLPNEIINEQYKVDKYFIDLVLPAHKLRIEIDEFGLMIRSEAEEKKK